MSTQQKPDTNQQWLPIIAIVATLIIGFGSIGGVIHLSMEAWKEAMVAILDSRLSTLENKLDQVIKSHDEKFKSVEATQQSLQDEDIRLNQNHIQHLTNHSKPIATKQ